MRAGTPPGQASTGAKFARFGLYAVLAIFCLWYLAPLYVMLSNSLKTLDEIRAGSLLAPPKSIVFDAWGVAWQQACIGTRCEGLAPYFWNSIRIVVPAVTISTLLGAFNGYVLTKWRFKGDNLLFALILFGSFIPYQAIVLPMAQTLGWFGIANTPWGLAFVNTVYGMPFTTLFFRNFYVNVPDELIKAATIDGAGFFDIFFRIILPLSPPIIVVTVIWQFTGIWNDFLFGAVFSSGSGQPVIVALNNLVSTTTGVKLYNVDFAGAIIAAIPTLFVYVVGGRYFVRGLTAGAVKG
jgi:glucose/mannose transport system permease protein